MTKPSLSRRLASEAVGSALLLATVIGSGIMAAKLAGGNVALALLGNTLATGAMLVVLVLALAPISGAHLNPAVSLVFAFGLVGTILCVAQSRPASIAYAVGLYISAAYWFTSSTSFANPAVTVARALSDTFAGIDGANAPAFVVAQFAGALVAFWFFGWLLDLRTDDFAPK